MRCSSSGREPLNPSPLGTKLRAARPMRFLRNSKHAAIGWSVVHMQSVMEIDSLHPRMQIEMKFAWVSLARLREPRVNCQGKSS